jgi:hypothetical protein
MLDIPEIFRIIVNKISLLQIAPLLVMLISKDH